MRNIFVNTNFWCIQVFTTTLNFDMIVPKMDIPLSNVSIKLCGQI